MARTLELSSRGPQFKFITMPIHEFVLGGERACVDADHEPIKDGANWGSIGNQEGCLYYRDSITRTSRGFSRLFHSVFPI